MPFIAHKMVNLYLLGVTKMYDPTLDDFIAMLTSDNAGERRNAAWMLGRQRDPLPVPALIKALNDPDHDVKVRVIETLGNLRDERAIMPLISALGDDSVEIRAQVIKALGQHKDFRALPSIIPFLGDSSPEMRAAAAQALAELPDQTALQPLLGVFLGDEQQVVRYLARQALLKIGGETLLNAMLMVIGGEHPPQVTIEILETLAGLHDKRAVPAIEPLIAHEDEFVAETAHWALRMLNR